MKKVMVVFSLVFGWAALGWPDSAIWYANCKNTGAQDGLTEATGFAKIQDAVDRAADGDTVIVRIGECGPLGFLMVFQ